MNIYARRFLLTVLVILPFMAPALNASETAAPFQQKTSANQPSASQSKEANKVIMFSATYCPACRQVKQYLTTRNIPFTEFDIEKSAAARSYFDKLGGRGTPLMVVNNHLMQGFSERRFWHYYQDSQ